MICKMCLEEEAIEGESLCQNCENTNINEDDETLEVLIENID